MSIIVSSDFPWNFPTVENPLRVPKHLGIQFFPFPNKMIKYVQLEHEPLNASPNNPFEPFITSILKTFNTLTPKCFTN
jgi:hypothetical protein